MSGGGSKPGERRGGRQKGTPNKATQSVKELLDSLGCDPIEGMALVETDQSAPLELRCKMFQELAQYVVPKRRAVEHSAEPGTVIAMPFVVYGQPEAKDLVTWGHE
jgi:hypothetical protein